MSKQPDPHSHSLEYESQKIVFAARAVALEQPTVEIFAALVIACASIGLCSLSCWMAIHT